MPASDKSDPDRNQDPPLTCRCPDKGRNLVVCIDGTSKQFGSKNTNVVVLYNLLIKDEKQLTYYNSGVGTDVMKSSRPLKYLRRQIYNKFDLALGLRFNKIMLDAYSWLSSRYQANDRIFLFGFSRGAYQVRALAAMIEKVGLIYRGNTAQIPFAYELYADYQSSDPPSELEKNLDGGQIKSKAQQFKDSFCYKNVKVHFVGAWDTVSSLGLRAGRNLPLTTDGMKHTCFFRHALALDERRVKFLPEYAYNGAARPDNRNEGSANDRLFSSTSWAPHTKEVWFAGTHSDIGGGLNENIQLHSYSPPLRWMAFEAIIAGLRVETFEYNYGGAPEKIVDSLNCSWWPLEWLPLRRLSYKGMNDFTRSPHKGAGREIREGQLIHASVFARKGGGNYFKAKKPFGWRIEESIEKDPFEKIHPLLSELRNQPINDKVIDILKQLAQIAASNEDRTGCLVLRGIPKSTDLLFDCLCRIPEHLDQATLLQAARLIISILLHVDPEAKHLKRRSRAEMPLVMRNVLRSDTDMPRTPSGISVAIELLDRFCSRETLCISHGCTELCRLDYSPDGKTIVSCAKNSPGIRMWSAETGAELKLPKKAQTASNISDVTFSPDGKKVVSGSWDHLVVIWEALEKGEGSFKCRPCIGHEGIVWSVGFSPDGKLVAAGSADKTVHLWDSETGESLKKLSGHTGGVLSVAFLCNGTKVVSGSEDGTVRVWDIHTGLSSDPFIGHSDCVLKVSAHENKIASSSSDRTVRIWDADAGRTILPPFTGHEAWVGALSWSEDGKRIASGSYDGTIRIWNADTGEALFGGPFIGHEDIVWSIAFSPDSNLLASCSKDGTIRVWDVPGELTSREPMLKRLEGQKCMNVESRKAEEYYEKEESELTLKESPREEPLAPAEKFHDASVSKSYKAGQSHEAVEEPLEPAEEFHDASTKFYKAEQPHEAGEEPLEPDDFHDTSVSKSYAAKQPHEVEESNHDVAPVDDSRRLSLHSFLKLLSLHLVSMFLILAGLS